MTSILFENLSIILFGTFGVVASLWVGMLEEKELGRITPGSIWKKPSGKAEVEVLQLDRSQGEVVFRYLGLHQPYERRMAWTTFTTLYERVLPLPEDAPPPVHTVSFSWVPRREEREALTKLAEMLGMKRRWWGWEPDFLLRRRIFKGMRRK